MGELDPHFYSHPQYSHFLFHLPASCMNSIARGWLHGRMHAIARPRWRRNPYVETRKLTAYFSTNIDILWAKVAGAAPATFAPTSVDVCRKSDHELEIPYVCPSIDRNLLPYRKASPKSV